jgi:aspartyl/asparaginyl beta-hydroxylase (cupin superfamily)
MWRLSPDDRERLGEALRARLGSSGLVRIDDMLALLVAVGRGVEPDLPPGRRSACVWLPGLETRPWLDAGSLPFLEPIRERWREIRAEYDRVSSRRDLVSYLPNDPAHERWTAFFFVHDGRWQEESARQCPVTHALLRACPIGPGDAMFSVLAPRAEIEPHHGVDNLTWTVHLGLDVPDGAALLVDGEARAWREGEWLVFDDSYRHSARNDSDARRAILLFDVWNAGLTAVERDALGFLLPEIFRLQPRRGPA